MGRSKSVLWTREEVRILKEISGKGGVDLQRMHRLPRRTPAMAHAKAVSLGLTPTLADRIVALMQDRRERTSQQIADELGARCSSVRASVSTLSQEGPDQELYATRVASDGHTLVYASGAKANAVVLARRKHRIGRTDENISRWWPKGDQVVMLAMRAMMSVGRGA